MNGVNLGYLAMEANRPDPEFAPLSDGFIFQMTANDTVYQNYRVAVRSLETGTLNWDTLYNFTGTSTLEVTGLDPDKEYFVSVMNVENGFEGLASIEYTHLIVGIGHTHMTNNIYILQTIPNPFSDETCITVQVGEEWINAAAEILIRDLAGKKVKSVSVILDQSRKTILIKNDSGMKGVYTCTLLVNGQSVQTRKLIAL